MGRLLMNLKNRRKTWNFELKSKVCFFLLKTEVRDTLQKGKSFFGGAMKAPI